MMRSFGSRAPAAEREGTPPRGDELTREAGQSLANQREPLAPDVEHVAESTRAAEAALSFREVYDRYFDFVWRGAAHRGVPASALDDVTQEVFIVIHRKLPEFEGRSSLRVWVAAILRRVVADFVRKRGNRPTGHTTLEGAPHAAAPEGEDADRRAALELLDGLLAKMTEEQRETFVLHEIEELRCAEIAELTGCNENTVWTRLRAARRVFHEGVSRQRARSLRQES